MLAHVVICLIPKRKQTIFIHVNYSELTSTLIRIPITSISIRITPGLLEGDTRALRIK